MVILLTPSPLTVHVVYVWPLIKIALLWGNKQIWIMGFFILFVFLKKDLNESLCSLKSFKNFIAFTKKILNTPS